MEDNLTRIALQEDDLTDTILNEDELELCTSPSLLLKFLKNAVFQINSSVPYNEDYCDPVPHWEHFATAGN